VETAGKILLVAALVLAILGVLLLIAGKSGLDRLPGDILIRRDGVTIYIPLGLMILVSLLGSLASYVLRRL
jgi:DUF2905 family protein